MTIRIRVKRRPLLRFSVTRIPFGAGRQDLLVGVVADDHVDVRDAVGEVEQRAGRCRERAAGRAEVTDRDDRVGLVARAPPPRR